MIAGCGNVLLGDDGFGPAVVNKLEEDYLFPQFIATLDAGTSLQEYLFNWLLSSDTRPDCLIIVDCGLWPAKNTGDLFFAHPNELPAAKKENIVSHQFPSYEMLHELQSRTYMEITLLLVGIAKRPHRIQTDISPELAQSIPLACRILGECLQLKSKTGVAHGI